MEIKELLLREIGKFKNNKIIFSNYHVSTDNMNKHNQPIFYSKKGNLYEKTNILMSNIRPYFNKVWYSDRTGSKSSNVLCFVVTNNNVLSKYAYYLICSDKFNNFWSKTSKGTTMPVGDKEAILNFKFKICDKANQQAIINIIEPFEMFIIFLSNKIMLLNNLKNKLWSKSFSSLKFTKLDFVKNCKGNIQQINEGRYRYYNCSSNVNYVNNYNEYSNKDSLIITTRGTITSHIIPKNIYFYATNNLIIFKGEGIHCFDHWFKNNKKTIISGTSIPMITKKDLNFLNFPYNENIEKILKKINNLIFFLENIKNIISIIIKKLIEIYIV